MATKEHTGGCVKIYALFDPRDGAPRYVGQTVQPLNQRLAQHCIIRRTCPKSQWIGELLAAGLRPVIGELQSVARAAANDAERRWIEQIRSAGEDLLNLNDPDLNAPRHPATSAKISAFRKQHVGWRHSPETRAKIGRYGTANAQAKLTEDDVRRVRQMCSSGSSQTSVARALGVSDQTVSNIVRRRVWAHVE